MEYFRLMQDQQQKHFPIMQGLMSLPDIQKVLQGEVHLLDKMTALFVQPDSENIYPPLLSRPLFLMNQELRQVFQMYLPQLEYRHICLIDNPSNKIEYYHAPCLMCSSCFSKENSKSNLDYSMVEQVALKRESIPDTPVFRLSGINDSVVVVSLPVAESILRRKIANIRLTATKLV